jgi:uncharacterized membrane protein YfcA
MHTYVWVCLILFLAGFTHGISGFGSVMLSIPLLAVVLDIKTVIPLANLVAVTMTVAVFLQLRHQFDWKKLYPLIWGAIPGIVLGVFFLKRLDKETIHWLLGVLLIGFAGYSLLFRPSRKKIRKKWAYGFGFLSGCLGGAFSALGPPVIVYTSLQTWSKDQIKVTLQAFFFLSGVVIGVSHALSGITTLRVLHFYAAALPALLLGAGLGSFFYGFMNEESYRRLIIFLLACLGVLMIYMA